MRGEGATQDVKIWVIFASSDALVFFGFRSASDNEGDSSVVWDAVDFPSSVMDLSSRLRVRLRKLAMVKGRVTEEDSLSFSLSFSFSTFPPDAGSVSEEA